MVFYIPSPRTQRLGFAYLQMRILQTIALPVSVLQHEFERAKGHALATKWIFHNSVSLFL